MPKIQPYRKIPFSDWILTKPGYIKKLQGKKNIDSRKNKRETVRQWLLRELIDRYNYPQEWIGHRIILINDENKKLNIKNLFGGIVTLENGKPFLILSIDAPGYARTAEENLRDTMIKYTSTGIGIATDGSVEGTIFLRKRFDSFKCEYISDIEPYNFSMNAPGSRPFINSKNKNKGRITIPLTNRIENFFFELHSYIRDIDGLHADEALDELCKIIYTKLYDEETTNPEMPFRLQQGLYGTSDELAAMVRTIYEEAGEHDLRVFRLKIPQYARSRGVFNMPIRLSAPAITKVIESLQRINLSGSDVDVKGRAFQKVIGPTVRSGMGQYFTPEPVIKFMVDVVQPNINELILDPFCGSGHFLSQCLEFVKNHFNRHLSNKFHEFAFGKLHGIEKSDRMVRIAMTDMRLHGDGHSNIRCTDALLDFTNYPDLEPASFDIILTNPPFGSLLTKEAIAQLGFFELAKEKNSVPLEILGLERCIQFLRPGGRMGIVLPDSILSNRGTHYVREWLHQYAKLRAIVSLPIETFSPFGANIKTSMLFLRKWETGESRTSEYKIELIRIDNVGYDASGRNKNEKSDLCIATSKLHNFFKKRGW